jgi:hypothetical protein
LNRIRFLKFELDFLTHWENSASLVSYHLRMDLLFSSLEGTLNPSNDVRRAAEAKLGEVGMARVNECEIEALDSIAFSRALQLSAVPGYLRTLLELSANQSLPVAGRTAAAIAFKNAVAHNWHPDSPSTPQRFAADEKEWGGWILQSIASYVLPLRVTLCFAVRGHIVDAAVGQVDTATVNALAEAFRWMATHDYPDRWYGRRAQVVVRVRPASLSHCVFSIQAHYACPASLPPRLGRPSSNEHRGRPSPSGCKALHVSG